MSFRLRHSVFFPAVTLVFATAFTGQAASCTLNMAGTVLTCTGGPGTGITTTADQNGGDVQASPYPSSITVSGITGTITAVQVTLNGVAANGTTGSTLEGAGFLLEAGTSHHYLEILHSVGNGGDESATLSNATINLADTNTSTAPNNTTGFFCGNAPTGGNTCTNSPTNPSSITFNWKPASYPDFALSGGGGEYPGSLSFLSGGRPQASSEPAGVGSATFASVFTGDSPNQTWNLYLEDDDGPGDAESISSWTLVLTLSVTDVSTTTVLTTGTNPTFTSIPTNTTLLTATVSATSTPTGTVTFTDTTTSATLCSAAALNGSGIATCSASFSTEGFHSIQAVYNPSGAFLSSNNTITNQWVKRHSQIVNGAYCNTGAISAPSQANTSPYPSVINVGTDTTGITNSLSTLTVTLNGLSAAQSGGFPGADMILVAPDNVHALNFLADVGYANSVTSANLTLSDSASGAFPQNLTSSVTGTVSYLPTYYINGGSDFNPTSPQSPAPQLPGTYAYAAPGGGSSAKTFTSEFDGTNANGDWKLFLYDDYNDGAVTASGGWCLNFTQSAGLATTTTVSGTPNGATTGATVTVTATVTAGGNPVTSGTVTFTENGVQVAGGPGSAVSVNSSGQASFTTSSLSEGDHTILATYGGNGTYSLSFGSYVQRVDDATSGPTISGNKFTYCNTGAITLPGPNNASDIGQASPNPSNIFVADLPGTINAVQVDLKSLHMQGTDDNTASLLVGPMALTADSFDFFSNTGTGASTIMGNFSFADSASGLVSSSSEPAAGTYQPTSYGSASTFFASSSGFYTLPSGPYNRAATAGSSTFANIYQNSNGNGTWSLYFNQNTHQVSDGLTNGWCLDLTVNSPVLTITKSHTGPGTGNAFIAGQTGTYTLNVGNSGPGSTNGQTVTVQDSLPSGFTQSNVSGGADWNCTTSTTTVVTCTSTTAISSGGSFPAITVTVTPAPTSGTLATNTASVSGAGMTGATSTPDTANIIHASSLGIAKSHTGTFTQGGTAVWNLQVSNNSSAAGSATTGTTTVSDTLPTGYTLASYTGTGWTCAGTSTVTCTSMATVAGAGGTFPAIALTVNVPAASPVSVSNTAGVYGGGDPVHVNSGSAALSNTDSVTVVQTPASMSSNAGTTPQSATVNTAFAIAPAVTVKDAGSNPVAGVSVVFTAPATGASGTFSNSTNTITITTNGSGVASAPFMANSMAGGPYNVTAASSGLTTVNFSLTNTAAVSTGPTVVSFNVLFGTESYNVIGTARNRLPWQISGIQVVFSEPIASGNVNSLSGAGVTTTGFSGLGTNTLTWTISPLALGNFPTVLAGSGANAVKDAGGNALASGAGFNQNVKILYGDFNDDGVVNSQDFALVNAARSAIYNILADMNGDGVVNATDVQIVRTQEGTSLP